MSGKGPYLLRSEIEPTIARSKCGEKLSTDADFYEVAWENHFHVDVTIHAFDKLYEETAKFDTILSMRPVTHR